MRSVLVFPLLSVVAWAAQLKVIDGKLTEDGQPIWLRGAMYYQPHAFHQYFWEEVDIKQAKADFARMRQLGLNTVALQMNWGSFITEVDAAKQSYRVNAAAIDKLRALLQAADDNRLVAILWFGWSRIPEGVASNRNEESTDVGGRKHAAFNGYLLRDYPAIAIEHDFAWRCFIDFHRLVALETLPFGRIIFDPLDWQHLNINMWSWEDPRNLECWRNYLQQINPDLKHWDQRWGEANKTWADVLLPMDTWVKESVGAIPTSRASKLPVIDYEAAKWKDFNAWHNAVYNGITREITGALKAVRPDVLVMQRVDPWRFGYFRQQTWGPPGVDLYCDGYYPDTVADAANYEARCAEITKRTRDLPERKLPQLFWEVGIEVPRLYPNASAAERLRHQADAARAAVAAAQKGQCIGICWWVWQDYYMGESSKHWGLVDVNGQPKPAAAIIGGKP